MCIVLKYNTHNLKSVHVCILIPNFFLMFIVILIVY